MARRPRNALIKGHALPSAARGALIAIALGAAAAPLAGCGVNRVKTVDENGMDARMRHPIALTQQAYTLDVFPGPGPERLDAHTADQVASFAQRYHEIGSGPISILVPQTGPGAASGARAVDGIRAELARSGAKTYVTVSRYPVENPALAAPVRLAFDGLKAKVTHRCGDWPEDLASGSSTEGWSNRTYWNFGCASQNMIATQVADPRDLSEPRGESPSDAAMRMRGISNVRKGVDPSTSWSTKNSNIGSVGGQ